jgi:hypothetical protein
MEGTVAELLGLGMTHVPPLAARDQRMTSAFNRMIDHPANARRKARMNELPPLLLDELGDDSGLAAASRHRQRLLAGLRHVRAVLDEFRPDFVLVWGDDQYENFKESVIPPFCVLAYPEHRFRPWEHFHLGPNIWDEPDDTEFVVPGFQPGAKQLVSGLIERGFDVSYSYRPNEYEGLSHAFANTVMYLDYDRSGFAHPIVPMAVNCYGQLVNSARGLFVDPGDPPVGEALDPIAPQPWRCFELGAAVADVLVESPWRVALVASASWAHGFLTPGNDYVFPNLEPDQRLYSALERSDWKAWRDYPADQIVEHGAMGWETEWSELVASQLFNSCKAFAVVR